MTAMMTKKSDKVFLLGRESRPRFRFPLSITRVNTRQGIAQAMSDAVHLSGVFWIAVTREATDELLREAFHPTSLLAPHHGRAVRGKLGRLLVLHEPRPESIPVLEGLFSLVAWGTSSFKTLPAKELAEALASDNRHDLFIAGFVDPTTETVTLYRGDFEKISVPLSMFRPSGTSVPNPSALTFTDYGQTVRFGSYEAAADAILYEADADFRRRVNAKRRDEDKTFGACLRRLRKMKGLRQTDFKPIPAKTIIRIEHGATQKPHGNTLKVIADRLDVEPDEITSY